MSRGTRRPARATARAARPCRQTAERFTLIPATKSSSATASATTAPRATAAGPSRGNSHAWKPGASEPRTVGPSSRPATISPITGGWPRRRAVAPRTWAAPSSAASPRKKTVRSPECSAPTGPCPPGRRHRRTRF